MMPERLQCGNRESGRCIYTQTYTYIYIYVCMVSTVVYMYGVYIYYIALYMRDFLVLFAFTYNSRT